MREGGALRLGIRGGLAVSVGLAVCVSAAGCGTNAGRDQRGGKSGGDVVLTPQSVSAAQARAAARAHPLPSKARLVTLQGVGQKKTYGPPGDYASPSAPSVTQVKSEVKQEEAQLSKFRQYLDTSDDFEQTGPQAKILRDGTAVAPENAPTVIQQVIEAGNAISKLPYKWGGGHGAWRDNGYDCSGSVSFALAGAGLLDRPLTSGLFARWGAPGKGKWITIYANGEHVFMFVAGLRFDTSQEGPLHTRWQDDARSLAGFSVRHIPGL